VIINAVIAISQSKIIRKRCQNNVNFSQSVKPYPSEIIIACCHSWSDNLGKTLSVQNNQEIDVHLMWDSTPPSQYETAGRVFDHCHRHIRSRKQDSPQIGNKKPFGQYRCFFDAPMIRETEIIDVPLTKDEEYSVQRPRNRIS
jgi:hypothetical protein